jgi:DNA-binding Xre family transcriptional regulator
MAQTAALLKTLKQALKAAGFTYQHVAQHLGMSEANVKRLFATQRVTLQRLEQICGLMQLDLSDLFALYDESRQRISNLTQEQERELVSDARLLLVAVSVRNHLSYEDIITHYQISEAECIRCLARLDRLKIIDLLPNNRIKLLIDEYFNWLPHGPIERFFQQQIQAQFLKSNFSKERELRLFEFGLLGDSSTQMMINKLKALAVEFTDLHRQDLKMPLEKRYNQGLLVAIRPWDLEVFKPFLSSLTGKVKTNE